MLRASPGLREGIRESQLVMDWKFGVPTYMMKISMPGISVPGDSMGKGLNRAQAYASCVAEFIERALCSPAPGERMLAARYKDLPGAVDPRRLGVFRSGCYSGSLEIDWVPAWNLTRAKSVLVPAMSGLYISRHYGHEYYRADAPGRRYTYSDSNGCSAGSCMEEAILHGLLEVIERDAIMINARNDLRPRRLCAEDILANSGNAQLRGLLRRMCRDKDTLVRIKCLTLDIDVCVIACLVIDLKKRSASIGYGAHLDPSAAVSRALTEAFQARALFQRSGGNWSISGFRDFLANRAAYLNDDSGGELPFSELKDCSCGDILEDLLRVVGLLKRGGMDALVVDRTPPGVAMKTVKVLVPGLQRVDWSNLFGHELLGGTGDDRVFSLPKRLGLCARAKRLEEMNLRQFTFY